MSRLKNIYTCFPGGKHKVLTMSYDDGKLEDRQLIEIFNRYGIKGTFHIKSGLKGPERIPEAEWPELYRGHEVSCHTVLHPTIARSPLDQVALQVLEDRRELERVMGYPVRGMSYPNGSWSEEIVSMLPSLGIEYSRLVGDTHGFGMPENFLKWTATCHHNHNLLEDGKAFTELFKTQYIYMMYVWGHSYEFTDRNNWDVMEDFCKLVGGRDDIWYATNIQIIDYMEAAGRMQYAADGSFAYNPSACPVWVSVNNEIVEVPAGTQVNL